MHWVRVIILLLVAALLGRASASGATCYKPSPPSSASEDAISAYVLAMEEYPRCWHRENILDRLEAGTITFEEKLRLNEEHDRILESTYDEISAVVTRLRSSPPPSTVQPVEASSPPRSTPPSGVDCTELERQSTIRLREMQARMQRSEGLCDSYKAAVELGEIGTTLYSSCPILDPSGEQLRSARQMIEDGRAGQRAACAR